MRRRLIPSVTLFLFHVLISLVVYQNTSFAEGTFTLPFSSDSIWNTPIADGAQHVTAGFSAKEQNNFIFEETAIHKVSTTDPLRRVYQKLSDPYCAGASNINTSALIYQVNIPDNLIYDNRKSNGIMVFVFPDGWVREGYLWERCSQGSEAAQRWYGGSVPGFDITGDGLGQGAQGGSKLPGLGGTIRKGELTTPPGVPIPHALKLALSARVHYYNANDPTPGYRWPAKWADGYASTAYIGTNPEVEMGSLFAIHPTHTDKSLGLRTEPGKKIFKALQTYGAYVVDTCCLSSSWQAWMLGAEIKTNRDLTVRKELEATYGITLGGTNQASVDFKSDLDVIYEQLMVVTNASSQNPKGPWTSTDSTPPSAPKGLRIQ